MPSVPTPAAARYIRAGEPRPPAPTARTLAFFSRFCPSIRTSGMIRWREYLRTSSTVSSAAGSTRGGSDTGTPLVDMYLRTVVLPVTLPRPFSFRDTRSDPRDNFVPVPGQRLERAAQVGRRLGAVGEKDRPRALPAGDAHRLVEVGARQPVDEVAE